MGHHLVCAEKDEADWSEKLFLFTTPQACIIMPHVHDLRRLSLLYPVLYDAEKFTATHVRFLGWASLSKLQKWCFSSAAKKKRFHVAFFCYIQATKKCWLDFLVGSCRLKQSKALPALGRSPTSFIVCEILEFFLSWESKHDTSLVRFTQGMDGVLGLLGLSWLLWRLSPKIPDLYRTPKSKQQILLLWSTKNWPCSTWNVTAN